VNINIKYYNRIRQPMVSIGSTSATIIIDGKKRNRIHH